MSRWTALEGTTRHTSRSPTPRNDPLPKTISGTESTRKNSMRDPATLTMNSSGASAFFVPSISRNDSIECRYATEVLAPPLGTPRVRRVSGLITSVDGDDVVVRYADPEHHAEQVSVWAHLRLGDTTMARVEGGWEVRLSDLPVDRLEYLLDVDGRLQPDPGNPHVVPGPFGDHSWIALPGYREPGWLGLDAGAGRAGDADAVAHGGGADRRRALVAGRRRCRGAAAAADQPRRSRDGRLRRAHVVRRRADRRWPPAPHAGRAGRGGRAQQEVRRQPGVRPGALRPGSSPPYATRRRSRVGRC